MTKGLVASTAIESDETKAALNTASEQAQHWEEHADSLAEQLRASQKQVTMAKQLVTKQRGRRQELEARLKAYCIAVNKILRVTERSTLTVLFLLFFSCYVCCLFVRRRIHLNTSPYVLVRQHQTKSRPSKLRMTHP